MNNYQFICNKLNVDWSEVTGSMRNQLISHSDAISYHKRFENEIISMLKMLAKYADSHEKMYNTPIGSDGVIGDAWLGMAKNFNSLLNGETGRLDCGTVHSALLSLVRRVGFSDFEFDRR